MRILLDENIHPQVVALLRDAGHDVLSITETDKGASDPVVFQTAVSDERVLVTHDTGFGRLYELQPSTRCAVMLFRVDEDLATLAGARFIANTVSVQEPWPYGIWTIQVRHRIPVM